MEITNKYYDFHIRHKCQQVEDESEHIGRKRIMKINEPCSSWTSRQQ